MINIETDHYAYTAENKVQTLTVRHNGEFTTITARTDKPQWVCRAVEALWAATSFPGTSSWAEEHEGRSIEKECAEAQNLVQQVLDAWNVSCKVKLWRDEEWYPCPSFDVEYK